MIKTAAAAKYHHHPSSPSKVYNSTGVIVFLLLLNLFGYRVVTMGVATRRRLIRWWYR
jgi:hypothetical protein